MKALVGAFNQEKALVGAFSVIVQPVVEPMEHYSALPRFPLFGGWKTHYVIGYNVPSYEYLFYSSDKHVLNMRLVDHIFDDMLVEETEVKVILPEGVSDIKVSAVKRSIGSTTGCIITEKAPTRAFSWLKAATTTFKFKTLLRHYAKRALTPRSLNVKLGP